MKQNPYNDMRVGRLKRLEPIFANWRKLHKKHGADWINRFEDAPWWYNERASISFLSGAIWLSHGWALEEFASTKTVLSENRGRIKYTGRSDLMFEIRRYGYIAKVKECWPNLTSIPNAMKTVRETVRTACQDCRRGLDLGYLPLGIVFAAPKLHKTKKKIIDERLTEFVSELVKLDKVGVAWTFPNEAVELQPAKGLRNEHYIYPGEVLIIKPV
jgi:hypothetical protein